MSRKGSWFAILGVLCCVATVYLSRLLPAMGKSWGMDIAAYTKREYQHEQGVLLLLCFHSPVLELYQKQFKSERGKPHHELISKLLHSIREHSPDLLVAIATDDTEMLAELQLEGPYSVVPLDLTEQKRHYQEKLFGLLQTPFRRTLYLDSDTIVCADLQPVFDDLKQIDVAFPRISEGIQFSKDDTSKSSFHNATLSLGDSRLQPSERFYSAFMLYKMSPAVEQFLVRAKTVSLTKGLADQEALLQAVRTSGSDSSTYNNNNNNLRVQLLSHEYLYVDRRNELPTIVSRDVMVVHGIHATCHVNDVKGPRLLWNGNVYHPLP